GAPAACSVVVDPPQDLFQDEPRDGLPIGGEVLGRVLQLARVEVGVEVGQNLVVDLEVLADQLDLAGDDAGSRSGAGDVRNAGVLRGGAASREADEGLAGLQVGHELGRSGRLDAVVRGDTVTAVERR